MISRRRLLCNTARTLGAASLASAAQWLGPSLARAAGSGAESFGPLQPPDVNGLMLPVGFTSRVVATTGSPVGSTAHVWHPNPDGGATFATNDGGWVYVSNSETSSGGGGVGAIRFASNGAIADAYSILTGTSRNCAGGATPWNTWLSCEEVPDGRVYECDPMTPGSEGTPVPALGTFNHEAAAIDAIGGRVYLTEDQPNGLFYRMTPASYPSLASGSLEAAEILDPQSEGPIQVGQVRGLAWHAVAEPNPANGGVQNASHLPVEERATRFQAPSATSFNGGEGCFVHGRDVYFSTKGDQRVWRVDAAGDEIEIVYDFYTSPTPELSGPDNVFVAMNGDVYVAEDPGNLQIVALTPGGGVVPIVQVTGQTGSEVTGPALDPSGTRLYFSSQRLPGTTYEVTGPFLTAPQVPALGSAGWGTLMGAMVWLSAQRLRA